MKKNLLVWFTGEGPPMLEMFGDTLGASLTGDQGSLLLETAAGAGDALAGAAAATPPQGSSWGCLGGSCKAGMPHGSIEDEAAVRVGGGGCATGLPKSKSRRSSRGLLLLDLAATAPLMRPESVTDL